MDVASFVALLACLALIAANVMLLLPQGSDRLPESTPHPVREKSGSNWSLPSFWFVLETNKSEPIDQSLWLLFPCMQDVKEPKLVLLWKEEDRAKV